MKTATTDKTGRKEGITSALMMAGMGVGLGAFAVLGIVNASFIGGIVGLNIAGAIMGFPVESALIARVLVALGMLGGVAVAGLVFITAGAVAGWALGRTVDAVNLALHHGH